MLVLELEELDKGEIEAFLYVIIFKIIALQKDSAFKRIALLPSKVRYVNFYAFWLQKT